MCCRLNIACNQAISNCRIHSYYIFHNENIFLPVSWLEPILYSIFCLFGIFSVMRSRSFLSYSLYKTWQMWQLHMWLFDLSNKHKQQGATRIHYRNFKDNPLSVLCSQEMNYLVQVDLNSFIFSILLLCTNSWKVMKLQSMWTLSN